MDYDCIDICDKILTMMCTECPLFHDCMPHEDNANHEQMLVCLDNIKDRLNGVYPSDIICPYPEHEE